VVKAHVCPLSGQKPGPHCPGSKEEWFIAGTEPTEECGMHQEVALAKADGLPVPPGCHVPASAPQAMTLWPSPFDTWAVSLGKGVADTWTSACPPPPETETKPPRLLAPALHEIVRIDPQRPLALQQMLLLADAGKSRLPLDFTVDGVVVEERLGPHAALWAVTPGEHQIAVRRRNGQESDVHTVVVR
jgi:penicillin-binding protein 1C